MRIKSLAMLLVMVMFVSIAGNSVYAAEEVVQHAAWMSGNEEWTLTNGDLTASATGNNKILCANQFRKEGKWYFEAKVSKGMHVGIASEIYAERITISESGIWNNDTEVKALQEFSLTEDDVVGVEFDFSNYQVSFYINGGVVGYAYMSASYGYAPALFTGKGDDTETVMTGTANFGMLRFEHHEIDYMAFDELAQQDMWIKLEVGDTTQLSPAFDWPTYRTLSWSTTNAAIVTVDENGNLTAIGEGEALVLAKHEETGLFDYIRVKVAPKEAVKQLSLSVNLKKGETLSFYLNDDSENIAWESIDSEVATVDKSGEVTGLKEGFTGINAIYNNTYYMVIVNVIE